eukprot:TRINITY_DN1566_c0_g1_i1.p1 TRINITY_DN1566_c0_g1~~TRINITY_DN1566_c0_g1_i1.p1  ORF type:complete len:299 (+),score=96.69 TRINITY_DN1566_c0_g1_i1:37-933(+)
MAAALQAGASLPEELRYIPGHAARVVTIDDFELGKQLGEGKYGYVFAARDKKTNAIVALKRMPISAIVKDRLSCQVLRELEIMQALQHPNILRMYTYFVDKEYINLVVEYAPLGDVWNVLLQEKRFSLKKTARLVAQLTEACSYAHKHGVVHRDIKPENLLLDANKNLKLADFGWSAFIRKGDDKRKTYCGTPDYIPPEMESHTRYDFTVDHWCIGVFAYECLFGKPPFEASDDIVRAKKILAQEYSFPPKPVLPEEAYDLIRNLLIGDPKKRMSLDDILSHPFIVKYYQPPNAVGVP